MRRKYEEQQGICPLCHQHYEIEEMEGDHITPWSQGGKTEYSNLQMLCKKCNREKSNH
jgi:5-methylcytosine-specific restriction endonuclease McrA